MVGDFLGFKSIKLIGWGVTESGTSFWIATNTWGSSWGERGFFRIKMGPDHSTVEFSARAGRVYEDAVPNVEYVNTDTNENDGINEELTASKSSSEFCGI